MRRGGDAIDAGRHGRIVTGRNPVLESLRSGRKILRIYVSEEARRERAIEEIQSEAAKRGVEVLEAPRTRLDGMTQGERHQGVIAVCEPRGYASVEDVLALAATRGEAAFVLLLDGVQDPHNLGAILRVADGAGVHGVVIPERGSASLTPGAYKSSAGAAEHVLVARVANLMDALQKLKRAGVWIGGTEAGEGKAVWDERLTGPVAIVMGSEDAGLSHPVRKHCDFLFHIPLKGAVSSLNVSVAAAVVAFERLRQTSGTRSPTNASN